MALWKTHLFIYAKTTLPIGNVAFLFFILLNKPSQHNIDKIIVI